MADLATLVTHAVAASGRFHSYEARPDRDDHELRELEQANHEARRAVRAKLAEMRVDPRMLRSVIS